MSGWNFYPNWFDKYFLCPKLNHFEFCDLLSCLEIQHIIVCSFASIPGPDSAPANLHGNATSSTAIELSWDLLPLSLRHGILTQYHIRYSPAGNPENSNHEDINGGETLQGTISGLLYWTEYGIDIAARTHVGYGPKSAMIFIRTHEHRMLHNNVFILPYRDDFIISKLQQNVVVSNVVAIVQSRFTNWNLKILTFDYTLPLSTHSIVILTIPVK